MKMKSGISAVAISLLALHSAGARAQEDGAAAMSLAPPQDVPSSCGTQFIEYKNDMCVPEQMVCPSRASVSHPKEKSKPRVPLIKRKSAPAKAPAAPPARSLRDDTDWEYAAGDSRRGIGLYAPRFA
ncbi:MAG: hypothetical protein WDO70_08365 [Alphaproteobacteria bacterium]